MEKYVFGEGNFEMKRNFVTKYFVFNLRYFPFLCYRIN